MTDDALVCDIKNVLFIRFAFGFLQNFNGSSKTRRLSYLYVILFLLLLTALLLAQNELIALSYRILALIEYLILFMISFLTKEEYIHQYYKLIHGLDTSPGAKKIFQNLENFLKVSFVLGLTNNLLCASLICFRYPKTCSTATPFFFVPIILHRLACDVGGYTLIMFISVLYSRVKLLRAYFDTKLGNTAWESFSVRQYINMYESLINTIDDSAVPVKVTTAVTVISSMTRVLYSLSNDLATIKEKGFAGLSKTLILGYLNEPIFLIILGTITLDIINDDYSYMKTKILEQRTQAKNERLRRDLQDLLMLLENRPLRFDLLPNLPLTTKLFLNCLSFFILNIIAVLQIRTFYS